LFHFLLKILSIATESSNTRCCTELQTVTSSCHFPTPCTLVLKCAVIHAYRNIRPYRMRCRVTEWWSLETSRPQRCDLETSRTNHAVTRCHIPEERETKSKNLQLLYSYLFHLKYLLLVIRFSKYITVMKNMIRWIIT